MNSWKIYEPYNMKLTEETAQLSENTVKVKISQTAVSSTDLSVYKGLSGRPYPITPCRIASAFISEEDESRALKKGERVLITPYVKRQENLKSKDDLDLDILGYDQNGLLSDFAVVPDFTVNPLPDTISEKNALFIEYVAMAIRALEELNVQQSQYIVIYGAGLQGNILAQLAMYYQAVPIVIDSDIKKLETAKDCGIYYTVHSKEEEIFKKVLEITCGKMADASVCEFSATQPPTGIAQVTRTRGRVGLVSYNKSITDYSLSLLSLLSKQLTVKSINNGCREISSAINILLSDAILLDDLVEKEYPFKEADRVFEELSHNSDTFKKTVLISD